MKTALALIATLTFSSSVFAVTSKSYKGQDDHGKECSLVLIFEEGKVKGIVVSALGDETGKKVPVPVFQMMLANSFESMVKTSGSYSSGKFYFQAKQSADIPKVKLEKSMGLAIDLKRGTMTMENKENMMGKKARTQMSCVGLKEWKDAEVPPGLEDNPCDIEENAAMRNMCVVERGKKNGSIPEGAVAMPVTPGAPPPGAK